MSSLVSILIPCYNAERWIDQAIESALAQTWPEKEVIVIDDGSTDSSVDVIKTFDDRIRWETGPNRGGNVVRNRLLEQADGDWLQYLDADDYLLPNKIASQMRFLATAPQTDIVYGPVTLEHRYDDVVRREQLTIPAPHDEWVLLARWFLPQTGAALWRKVAIEDVGGWKPDQPCCQEHELYLRLLIAGKRFTHCVLGGAIYRQWSDQTVCKRDLREVHRRRLKIEQEAEDYLKKVGQLTPARLSAINQGRFEIARIAWRYDQALAQGIMATVQRSHPEFIPVGNAAPWHYQLAWRLLGFPRAQQLADWRRRWFARHDAVVGADG